MADGPSRLVDHPAGADCRCTTGCLRPPRAELRGVATLLGRGFEGWRSRLVGDAGAGGRRAVGQTLSLPGDFSSYPGFFSTLGRRVA
jgi:hypothetical protein